MEREPFRYGERPQGTSSLGSKVCGSWGEVTRTIFKMTLVISKSSEAPSLDYTCLFIYLCYTGQEIRKTLLALPCFMSGISGMAERAREPSDSPGRTVGCDSLLLCLQPHNIQSTKS